MRTHSTQRILLKNYTKFLNFALHSRPCRILQAFDYRSSGKKYQEMKALYSLTFFAPFYDIWKRGTRALTISLFAKILTPHDVVVYLSWTTVFFSFAFPHSYFRLRYKNDFFFSLEKDTHFFRLDLCCKSRIFLCASIASSKHLRLVFWTGLGSCIKAATAMEIIYATPTPKKTNTRRSNHISSRVFKRVGIHFQTIFFL